MRGDVGVVARKRLPHIPQPKSRDIRICKGVQLWSQTQISSLEAPAEDQVELNGR